MGLFITLYMNPISGSHITLNDKGETKFIITIHKVMNLRWPKGASVNDVIHKCKYLDIRFYLQYPSIDN